MVSRGRQPVRRSGVNGVLQVGEARMRLNADATGALLLTNDGELAHRLAHPSHEVDKVYVAEVKGDPGAEALAALERGVELDDGRSAPARARRLGPGRVELTIHEGRQH